MRRWQQVCCCVDGGDPSRAALDEAVLVAKMANAALRMLHVRTPPPAVVGAAGEPFGAGIWALQPVPEEDRTWLAEWRARAARQLGRDVALDELDGPAGDVIAAHGRSIDCDVIVVGTRGQGGLARAVFGSVADDVARHAPCPVLVVRAPGERAADAREGSATHVGHDAPLGREPSGLP